MTPQLKRLLDDALQLTETERAQLAGCLLESLDENIESDENYETAWSEEILKRIQELESGEVKGIPWHEARRMILDDRDEHAAP